MDTLRGTIKQTFISSNPTIETIISINDLWVITATIMVLSMQAGFLMLEAGSVRSKNTINVAQKNIADFIVCGCVFILIGAPIMFGAGESGWFGFGSLDITQTQVQISLMYQFAFCTTAATIISGAVSERMYFHVYLLLIVLISGIIYPFYGHLVWGNTILKNNPALLADLGFLDFAGSAVVHILGGSAALAAVLLIGPRKDLFDAEGKIQKLRGHSSVLSNFGTMILMFGWLGFNAGGASPSSDNFSQILLNTIVAMTFGGAAGLLYSVFYTKGKAHPKTTSTSILGGLVAITAGCAYVDHYGAIIIGFSGGLSAILLAYVLLHRFRIDDPVDAIAIHAGAGIIGTLLLVPFASDEFITGSRMQQFFIQLGGLSIAIIWAFGMTLMFLLVLRKFTTLRVTAHEEEIGLNIAEHDTTFDVNTVQELMNTPTYTDGATGLQSVHVMGEELGDNAPDSNQHLNLLSKAIGAAQFSKQEAEQAQSTIEMLATYDQLTGLYNRVSFRTNLAKYQDQQFALIYLDLDGFKAINDGFGHNMGDKVLCEIADRIIATVPRGSIVSRFGGDEFVICIPIEGPIFAPDDTKWQNNCSALVDRISQMIEIGNNELFVGASLGVALFPHDADNIDNLILKADMALFEAKAAGKAQWVQFKQKMEDQAHRRIELETDMRAGIERNEFYAQYQPQTCIKEMRLLGFEALMRWNHPVHGNISPMEFIPIAEQTGLITEISEKFILETCKSTVNWPLIKGKHCRLSINLSPVQFRRSNVPDMLRRIIKQSGIAPENLEVEVTESTLIENIEEVKAALELIRNMGIKIAVDDFGTGYSSLSYLQGFPLDRLKVDRSFVSNMENSQSALRVTKAIVDLGKSLELNVIAEGVETEEQRRLLEEFGCDEIQGYFFSPPVSLAKTLALITNANRQPSTTQEPELFVASNQ